MIRKGEFLVVLGASFVLTAAALKVLPRQAMSHVVPTASPQTLSPSSDAPSIRVVHPGYARSAAAEPKPWVDPHKITPAAEISAAR